MKEAPVIHVQVIKEDVNYGQAWRPAGTARRQMHGAQNGEG